MRVRVASLPSGWSPSSYVVPSMIQRLSTVRSASSSWEGSGRLYTVQETPPWRARSTVKPVGPELVTGTEAPSSRLTQTALAPPWVTRVWLGCWVSSTVTGASPVVGGNSGSKVTPPVPSSSVARVSGSPPSGSVEEAVNSQPGPAFREPDT
ncbi:hypothetical protein CWI85_23155, partial [Streptomyces albidoflavus]